MERCVRVCGYVSVCVLTETKGWPGQTQNLSHSYVTLRPAWNIRRAVVSLPLSLSLSLSLCLSLCLPVSLSLLLSLCCLCLWLCLSVCLSVCCLSVCLSVCLSLSLSLCLSDSLTLFLTRFGARPEDVTCRERHRRRGVGGTARVHAHLLIACCP